MTAKNFPLSVVTHDFKEKLNPHCTYFRTSDVTPEIVGDELHVIDGQGKRRSWGSPNVSTTVSKLNDSVIKATVTGWHKHTVSPVGGDYYFVEENGKWVRRRANHSTVKAALGQ